MNCNHPIVRKFIIDCLRYWVINTGWMDSGLSLASILGRDQNGAPMENPPILEALAFDFYSGGYEADRRSLGCGWLVSGWKFSVMEQMG